MKQHSGNKTVYTVVGMMSGTSLDGLDLAACEFKLTEEGWHHRIVVAETIEYPVNWIRNLSSAHELAGSELTMLDRKYGNYLGEVTAGFIKKHKIKALAVASHGHTIFHRPDLGYNLQIGHGANLAAAARLPVIADFRSTDIALGGQGAPLVPVGDQLLFSDYGACLNLGGFANISFDKNGIRKAGDICPVNIVLNHLSAKKGYAFDEDGRLGESGVLNQSMLEALNNLDFYRQPLPRSLGREWVEEYVYPLLARFPDTTENHLRTYYEHIAQQIAGYTESAGSVLVTGGGAFNGFLLSRMKAYTHAKLEVPDNQLVKYKEALIFAFLGLLRWRNEINCLKTVTGASRDSSSGAIYLP
jgi:anhydro-N-acetylmuramic acid kinase